MAKIPIGLQLFSVRGECQKDLPATLSAVAEMGYQGAEPWGYSGEKVEWLGRPAAEVRRLFDDVGLACCGIHLSTDALMGDRLPRSIELNQVLGNRFLIVAADGTRMKSDRSAILELAGILNAAAEKLRPLGMYCGYHAHGFDFATIDGEVRWDVLFGNTRSDVIMQLDIGNCASGGGDPIATLRKFPRRARSLHLKDYGGPPGAVIGQGQADWQTIFHLVETAQNTEWFVVEEGDKDGLGFDTCRRSLQALRRMGK